MPERRMDYEKGFGVGKMIDKNRKELDERNSRKAPYECWNCGKVIIGDNMMSCPSCVDARVEKSRQDEKKRIKDILQHAYDNLINNKNYLCFFGYLPKKQKEKNDILLKMFDARFDEIVFIYSDIMGISFNNAKKELEMNREIDYEYE